MRLVGCGVSVEGADEGALLPPPLLGEHGDAILDELGLDVAEIDRLRQSGVVR